MRYWVTDHCKERYTERITDGKRVDVVDIIKSVVSGKDITNKILDEVPRFVLYLHERYGEFGQKIIKSGDIVFILKKKEGTFDTFSVLTCYRDENLNHFNMYKNTSMSKQEIYIRISELKRKNKKKNR